MADAETTELAKRPANGPEPIKVDVRRIIETGGVDILTYDSRMVNATIKGCRTLLLACRDPNQTSDFEIGCFLTWCAANQYDPLFRKQAYFVRYAPNDPPSFLVNYEVFVDRAQRHPQFDGLESGIVWWVDGQTIRGKPCDFPRDDKHEIVGGWTVVHRKDRKYPVDVECPIEELIKRKRDGTPTKFWKEGKQGGMQTWMFEKVPIARALRRAFPEELAGQYTDAEPMMPLETTEEASELPSREARAGLPQETQAQPEPPSEASAAIQGLKAKMLELMGLQEGDNDQAVYDAILDLGSRCTDGEPVADLSQVESWTKELVCKCLEALKANGLDPAWLPGVTEGVPECKGQQSLPGTK